MNCSRIRRGELDHHRGARRARFRPGRSGQIWSGQSRPAPSVSRIFLVSAALGAEAASALAKASEMLEGLARFDVPLGPRTTYRVGGTAAAFVRIEATEDLEKVALAVSSTGVRVLSVGLGSNMLVADRGFSGLSVVLGAAFEQVSIDVEQGLVVAGAAAAYPVVARRTATAGLGGLEWAVGIPGSVGGAVAMNAGGHGSQTAESLISADVFDLLTGTEREVPVGELELGYRRSAIGAGDVVCRASFQLRPGEDGLSEIAEIVRWRREHQPGGRNAGSVFTNPPGDSAGRLIEQAGLKGYRRASAVVSEKHANFILADEDGSADDVYALIDEVRSLVAKRCDVELETELRLIGFGS